MVITTTAEREAKFEVDRDYDPPDFRDLVGRTERLPEQRLRTVYYDTEDGRLGERGISLRHRSAETAGDSGGDSGKEETWTLKLPEGPGDDFLSRSETSWPGDRATIPPQAAAILRGLVRRGQLRPIAELDTTRRRLRLFGADETTTWGELDDDLVSVVGGPGDGSWFRQIELELTADRPAEADAILESLRRSGAKPTKRSKISMAMGELADRPAPAPKGKPPKRLRVSDIVMATIASNLDKLLDHDYRLRLHRDQPDPHDVHQARVASRRLRSNLEMLGPVIDPVWLDHTTEELRWIGGVLGEVRDLDVLSANLTQADRHATDTVELVELIRLDRKAAVKKLSSALTSRRYLDLLDRLNAASRVPPLLDSTAATGRTGKLAPGTKASEALPLLVGEQWRALTRKARKADSRSSDEELHKIRIRAKRLRYAAETAMPVIGTRAEKIAKGAEALQDLLGELRDSGAAEDWLRRNAQARPLSSATAFASGALAGRQHARQTELRERWCSVWKSLNRKSNRRWVRSPRRRP